MEYRYLNPTLPLHKKGDDLAHWLEQSAGDPAAALRSYSDALLTASQNLARLAELLDEAGSEGAVKIHADSHHIGIRVPSALGARMIDEAVAFPDPAEMQMLENGAGP